VEIRGWNGRIRTNEYETWQSTVGAVTGSHAWTSSGEQAKAHGVATMKSAAEKRDPASQGFGGVEALAGKTVGCEGMQREGEASRKKE